MRERRTAIVISPSATLDERIRGLFPPGAVYNCEPEPMETLVERRMRRMSSDIRSKSDWIDSLNDADARACWATEAKEKGLTDVELAYVLDELAYYVSLHSAGSNIRLSAADGVWFCDALVDAQTTSKLRDYAALLDSVPDRQKDWYPNNRYRILYLIDPSLFPLIYSQSWLCRQASTSPQAAIKLGETVDFPGSFEGWHKALNVTEGGKPDYYLPDAGYGGDSYSSFQFSWLPSEFRIDDNGAVTIESYINNLHPLKHAVMYPIIASVFSKFIPLLEQVVTDLVHPRQPRVKPDSSKYYESDEPRPGDDDEKVKLWKTRATFVHPQPESFVAPTRPINPYKLRGRRLQAIVEVSSIELTPEIPRHVGKGWNVAGYDNERIIATGIFFYDVENIVPRCMKFREGIRSRDFEAEQLDIDSIIKVYGMEQNQVWGPGIASQELGSVGIKDGRCVVFPNTYQYEARWFRLADETKTGHCKMLTFYFVDPSTRIPSTEIVPPQQQDWWVDDLLLYEPFRSLPQLVVNGIMNKVDFPVSLKEAKKLRPKVHQGFSSDILTYILFDPPDYFSD
ncbi:hypothetical protein GGI13_000772 [Coemansia sp. RSA 455]|nr:hypothetical protein LPJ71_000812 [Coemansia sp. S17]KAJ2017991.1 hypothetical protein GGI14_002609 [Coemansia sp. S680]KAJ2099282.1 hypothetical protein GGI09_002866 [Coemansia sp. S100]KAJ2104656.1 hypothetical protein GGI16_002691 [Coemansia sp. S142-1]KAJ2257889.1 hypothetical protein GGI13_000772 [Coemansia sp. RSA 455]KAJ2467749.1 hypothetical protein GGI03_001396 [Coemansia sp. RSA 2337]